MTETQNEFKKVTQLRAEAIGAPGQRAFRLLVSSGRRSAVLWLEKEQLLQMALAIRQLLIAVAQRGDPPDEASYFDPEDSPRQNLEFKVGKMSLGQDTPGSKFVLEAYDIEADQDGPPMLLAWATRAQAEKLAAEAIEVCAAGRPQCLLCGGPIDPTGHVCPRSNGHRQISKL